MKYNFTTDWFSNQSTEIKSFLDKAHFIEVANGKDAQAKYNVLEIGAFEGRSTVWWCDTYPGSAVLAIDNWRGGAEHQLSGIDMRAAMDRFDLNCKPHGESIYGIEGNSHSVLSRLVSNRHGASLESWMRKFGIGLFDIAFIDGSHMADDTLLDAMLAAKLLKPGGHLIFDDYRWRDSRMPGPKFSPRLAVDSFQAVSRDFFESYKGYIAIFTKDIK